MTRKKHLVPDLLAPGLDLVLCGTAPSPASFKARAYYANPGNAFWPTLHAVGLTQNRFSSRAGWESRVIVYKPVTVRQSVRSPISTKRPTLPRLPRCHISRATHGALCR